MHWHAGFSRASRPLANDVKNSIKERKYVSAQMNQHPPLLEEIVFAFQDPRVLRIVGDITGLRGVEPDSNLYAGASVPCPKVTT